MPARLANRQLDDHARQCLANGLEVAGPHRPEPLADRHAVAVQQRLIGLLLVMRKVRRGMHAEAGHAGRFGPDSHGRELGHDTAGHEHRGRLAEQRGDLALEALDQLAFSVLVVLDLVFVAPRGELAKVVGRAARREVGQDETAALAQFATFGGRGGHGLYRMPSCQNRNASSSACWSTADASEVPMPCPAS